jgi:hypothetical protein
MVRGLKWLDKVWRALNLPSRQIFNTGLQVLECGWKVLARAAECEDRVQALEYSHQQEKVLWPRMGDGGDLSGFG